MDMFNVHHQEYPDTIMQQVFVILVLLVSASVMTPADANRTSMTNTYCVYAVWRYS